MSVVETEELSPKQRAEFLDFVRTDNKCSVKAAAESVGVKRKDVRALLSSDEDFAIDYREARGYGDDKIRARIWSRAMDDEKPADRLLIELARAYLPEYRDTRRLELTGAGGGPVEIEKREVSLVAVLAVLADAGALAELGAGDAGSVPALAGAGALLPAPTEP